MRRLEKRARFIDHLNVTAGLDPLLDEALAFHRRMAEAGVPSEHRSFDATIHGFPAFAGVLDAGREGLALVADRVRRALSAAPRT